jgi:hypothetical protein
MKEIGLNYQLAALGYTTQSAGLYRKDILHNGVVVLAMVTAGDVWEWLRSRGEI